MAPPSAQVKRVVSRPTTVPTTSAVPSPTAKSQQRRCHRPTPARLPRHHDHQLGDDRRQETIAIYENTSTDDYDRRRPQLRL